MFRRLLISVLAATSLSVFAKDFHVVIDPGHGGIDAGAAFYNQRESHVVLQVAKRLANKLRSNKNYKVSMTRYSDKSLSLKERADFARYHQADLFISIHANSSPDPKATGGEIYFQNQLPANQESMFLASRENQSEGHQEDLRSWPLKPLTVEKNTPLEVVQILKDLQRTERIRLSGEFAKSIAENWAGKKKRRQPIRQAPFYVVSNVSMPSVLVELGFMSNSKEAQRLATNEYQIQLVDGIFDGIVHYKESLDK